MRYHWFEVIGYRLGGHDVFAGRDAWTLPLPQCLERLLAPLQKAPGRCVQTADLDLSFPSDAEISNALFFTSWLPAAFTRITYAQGQTLSCVQYIVHLLQKCGCVVITWWRNQLSHHSLFQILPALLHWWEFPIYHAGRCLHKVDYTRYRVIPNYCQNFRGL
jgi:hypothetical protein